MIIKKTLKVALSLSLLSALVLGVYSYLQYTALYPSTEDAYVQANVVHIAPQASGKISAVYVKNLQHVSKGQPLFDIDPTPFNIALLKAQANLDTTRQQVQASIDAIAVAKATVSEREAELVATEQSTHRTLTLVKKMLYPAADGDVAIRDLKVARAALATAQNQYLEAQNQAGDLGTNNASIRTAEATVAKARLDLSYTHVVAPSDGYISNFHLRKGSQVTASEELFAIIDDSSWWTTANFKETQLNRIRAGQFATIQLDMYPGHVFHGKVINISAGSGSSFALLPPENATGNWVKVTQRFPVRIEITDPTAQFPLRLGASTKVTINTKSDNTVHEKSQHLLSSLPQQ